SQIYRFTPNGWIYKLTVPLSDGDQPSTLTTYKVDNSERSTPCFASFSTPENPLCSTVYTSRPQDSTTTSMISIMRTSSEQQPTPLASKPRPGFKLGPLPTPSFSQNPTPTSAPSSGYAQGAFLTTQQQLQLQQREIIQQATRGSIPPHMGPVSPRLLPLGSPGPVPSPLTLDEGQSGYLYASATHHVPY